MLKIVVPPDFIERGGVKGEQIAADDNLGNFEILYDEAAEKEAERVRLEKEAEAASNKAKGLRRSD